MTENSQGICHFTDKYVSNIAFLSVLSLIMRQIGARTPAKVTFSAQSSKVKQKGYMQMKLLQAFFRWSVAQPVCYCLGTQEEGALL